MAGATLHPMGMMPLGRKGETIRLFVLGSVPALRDQSCAEKIRHVVLFNLRIFLQT